MNLRLPIALSLAAVALLALGCLAMVRVGSTHPVPEEKSSGTEGVQDTHQRLREPAKPTATFNVTRPHKSGVQVVPEMEEVASRLNDASKDPIEDLQVVEQLIQFHTRVFHSIPGGGENVDIMRALTGGNAKHLALIPPDHPSLNETGELVDRWGTPFHFHPVSKRLLEVRSAGPDRQLWTEDDVDLSESGSAGG